MSKLLFVTQLPFYPDSSGGAQLSALYLFNSLQQQGWDIEIVCGTTLRSPHLRTAISHSLTHFRLPFRVPDIAVLRDDSLRHRCWRHFYKFAKQESQWIEWLDRHLQTYQPDVVLGQNTPDCPLLNYAAQQGYPSFYFVRSLTCLEIGYSLADNIHLIANSPYAASVAGQLTNRTGIPAVLPFLDLNQYKVKRRDRNYITFINPIPKKGGNIAVEIARQMPQERFLFVKGKWSLYDQEKLEEFIEPAVDLPNVEIWEHQWDMRRVYEVSDILLVPSQFTETFGRVILEAQVNRIPVVAANTGGIPYTLGSGGMLVSPKDNVAGYVEALKQLRHDPDLYQHLSELAFQNSQRAEFDPHTQVQKFIDVVTQKESVAIA